MYFLSDFNTIKVPSNSKKASFLPKKLCSVSLIWILSWRVTQKNEKVEGHLRGASDQEGTPTNSNGTEHCHMLVFAFRINVYGIYLSSVKPIAPERDIFAKVNSAEGWKLPYFNLHRSEAAKMVIQLSSGKPHILDRLKVEIYLMEYFQSKKKKIQVKNLQM